MRKAWYWGRFVAAAAGVVALASWGIPGKQASAALGHQAATRLLSYQPLRGAQPVRPYDTTFGNMDYNGGPVMPANTDYMILWSPTGLSAYGSGSTPQYVAGIEQYFKDLAHDNGGNQNVDSVSTQYNDLSGASARYQVKFGGAVLDTDPYPTSQCPAITPVTECLTDAQIQAELEGVVKAHHLPHDLSHEYFLLTPPHVEGCFTNQASSNPPYGGCSAGEVPSSLGLYCAYHGNTTVSPMLFYADDPYVTGVSGCDDGNHPNGPSDGALVGGLSHEHNESITDPIPNDAWTNGAGSNHGSEIGDQCAGQMGTALGTAPDGAKYNQVINGHLYWYQEEWSNIGHTCLQRLTLPATLPAARFTITVASGNTLTFDASASSAPGGVAKYSWQFNDASGAQTVEQSTPVITHTFPASGAYSVGLAVFTANGTSEGTGAIVSTGQTSFTAGFTASPASPSAGQTVTFTGLASVSAKPVLTYLWEFGDGRTGSGQHSKHVYAGAGTYTVTEVLFSGVGSAFPGDGAAPIYTHTITVH